MTGRLIVALSLASLIAVSWSAQSQAQAPPPQAPKGAVLGGQKVPIGPLTQVDSPCVANRMSPECFNFRLNGVDSRLAGIDEQLRRLDATVRDLPARPGASIPGPLVQEPVMPGKADDVTNLQKQIDALYKTVMDLRNKVNTAIGK